MRVVRKIFLICLLFHSSLFPAAVITHFYFAQKYFDTKACFSEDERQAFVLGTLFPDIRYLRCIGRSETHHSGITLADVDAQENPFLCGYFLHSFVDEAREAFIEEYGMYESLDKILQGSSFVNRKCMLLKLLEDVILSKDIDPDLAVEFLQNINVQELVSLHAFEAWQVRMFYVSLWHTILAAWLRHGVEKIMRYVSTVVPLSVIFVGENKKLCLLGGLSEKIMELSRDEGVICYVQALKKYFDNLYFQKNPAETNH